MKDNKSGWQFPKALEIIAAAWDIDAEEVFGRADE